MDNQLTLANRNNNPGNIRDTSTGNFKQFNSPQEGYAALLNDLEIKKTGKSSTGLKPESTLADFAKAYAPSSDNNNPAQYTANLANHMGVRPDSKLSELDTGKWAEAIANAEGYKGQENGRSQQTPQGNGYVQPPAPVVPTPTNQTPQTVEQQRQDLEAQGQPVSVNSEKTKPTFAGNVIRGMIKPFAEVGTNIVNAGQVAVGATPTQPFSNDYLGKVEGLGKVDITKMPWDKANTQTVKKSIGTGLEIGSTLATPGGVKNIAEQGLKGLVKQGSIQGAKFGASTMAAQSAGQALSENKTFGQAALKGLGGAATGLVGGAVLGGATGLLGAGLEKAGVKAIANNRTNLVNQDQIIDMVNPKLGPKQVQQAIKSGQGVKSGVMGDVFLKPSPRVIKAADSVTGIVDPNKTLIENVNSVRNAITNEAESLKSRIAQVDHPYVFKELQSKLKSIEEPISIKSDMTLSKQFGLVREAAMNIAKKNGGMVSTLLDARKEFDSLIEKEFPTLYDRANAPMKNAIISIRTGLNDFIKKELPTGFGFDDSMAKQTNMFNAIDGMSTKAGKEVGTSSIGRTIQRNPITTGLIRRAGEIVGAGGIFKGFGL